MGPVTFKFDMDPKSPKRLSPDDFPVGVTLAFVGLFLDLAAGLARANGLPVEFRGLEVKPGSVALAVPDDGRSPDAVRLAYECLLDETYQWPYGLGGLATQANAYMRRLDSMDVRGQVVQGPWSGSLNPKVRPARPRLHGGTTRRVYLRDLKPGTREKSARAQFQCVTGFREKFTLDVTEDQLALLGKHVRAPEWDVAMEAVWLDGRIIGGTVASVTPCEEGNWLEALLEWGKGAQP